MKTQNTNGGMKMNKAQQTPWLVETISGAAGGFSSGDVATLLVTTRAETVEEIRAKVAALPDLLEALEALLAEANCYATEHRPKLTGLCGAARAAIAKAKGGAN